MGIRSVRYVIFKSSVSDPDPEPDPDSGGLLRIQGIKKKVKNVE